MKRDEPVIEGHDLEDRSEGERTGRKIGPQTTGCPIPGRACPATITSTNADGSRRATSIISSFGSHELRSVGEVKAVHRPPAWDVTTTIVAPSARSCFA